MRLLTHNQLVCVRKGCNSHYPLDIAAKRVEATYSGANKADKQMGGEDDEEEDESEEDEEPNLDFIVHLLPNLDYTVLYNAATKLGLTGLPEKIDASSISKEKDVELLTRLHQVLMDTHIEEGALVCGKCGRQYPIQQGIPNMRLNEDEVA